MNSSICSVEILVDKRTLGLFDGSRLQPLLCGTLGPPFDLNYEEPYMTFAEASLMNQSSIRKNTLVLRSQHR